MKHPVFAFLGKDYPRVLEEKYDRVLVKIEQLWGTTEIEEYFTDLIVDSRGGRKGFPQDVLDEIVMLRQVHRTDILKRAHDKERAHSELKRLGIPFTTHEFLNAVHVGDRSLVDLFVQGNINIHVLDDQGNPPLMVALKKGYTVIALILINAGAEVNEYDKMGDTPLLLSCGKATQGYRDVTERLISRGAYINERDSNGYTPLMLSLSAGTDEITELLIEKGADINLGTRNGITPLSIARDMGNSRIAKLLSGKGA